MSGVWRLSLLHAWHHRVRSAILMACLSLSLFLPVSTHFVIEDYRRDLEGRAQETPSVLGARGSRFDLTLSTLYFRDSTLTPIPFGEIRRIEGTGDYVCVPMNLRFTSRAERIVGTVYEYYELRGLEAREGRFPVQVGEVALGARVAARMGLSVGDSVFSDPIEVYDISKPSSLKMQVCGVLEEQDSPDDEVLFTDIKTTWILEGAFHGHQEAEEIEESLLLGKSEELVAVSQALIEDNEISVQNASRFHFHGDKDALPLTASIVIPKDAKALTILKAEVNTEGQYQMVLPSQVIEDLMAFVFRIKAIFDTLSAVLAVTTMTMTLLVGWLSMRLRKREMRTLYLIGCSRGTATKIYLAELAIVLAASVALATSGVLLAMATLPNIIRSL